MRMFVGALVLLATGCASQPSLKAAEVAESDEQGVLGCKFLGSVQGSSVIGGVVTTGAHNASVDAREQAAEMGANRIVFLSVEKGGLMGTGSARARAYRCGS